MIHAAPLVGHCACGDHAVTATVKNENNAELFALEQTRYCTRRKPGVTRSAERRGRDVSTPVAAGEDPAEPAPLWWLQPRGSQARPEGDRRPRRGRCLRIFRHPSALQSKAELGVGSGDRSRTHNLRKPGLALNEICSWLPTPPTLTVPESFKKCQIRWNLA